MVRARRKSRKLRFDLKAWEYFTIQVTQIRYLSARAFLFPLVLAASVACAMAAENASLVNPGFESGSLEPWKHVGAVRVRKMIITTPDAVM